MAGEGNDLAQVGFMAISEIDRDPSAGLQQMRSIEEAGELPMRRFANVGGQRASSLAHLPAQLMAIHQCHRQWRRKEALPACAVMSHCSRHGAIGGTQP